MKKMGGDGGVDCPILQTTGCKVPCKVLVQIQRVLSIPPCTAPDSPMLQSWVVAGFRPKASSPPHRLN